MKADKITVVITVEVLSLDSVPAIAGDALNCIRAEKAEGMLRASDGDFVKWETKTETVEV